MIQLTKQLRLVSLAVFVISALVSSRAQAQTFTPGYDATARICRFSAASSTYFHSVSESWGELRVEWSPIGEPCPPRWRRADGSLYDGNVCGYEWKRADGSLYNDLYRAAPPVDPTMTYDSTWATWEMQAYVGTHLGGAPVGHTLQAQLHPLGVLAADEWLFTGFLIQNGTGVVTARGRVACAH